MTKILPGYAQQVAPDFSALAKSIDKSDATEEKLSFPQIFKEMVNNTNDLQTQAQDLAEKFALGEVTDVHEVMVAAEEAGVALDLVMEVRNKLIDAYQELMRLQV
jgi:flagellar hook-basal body complex protein FliE